MYVYVFNNLIHHNEQGRQGQQATRDTTKPSTAEITTTMRLPPKRYEDQSTGMKISENPTPATMLAYTEMVAIENVAA